LLDPNVRASPEDAAALLHEKFLEYGVSGAVWDRTQILALLSADPHVDGEPRELRVIRLGPDAMLLTYHFEGRLSSSLRSSIWLRVEGRWQLRFHQGTPRRVSSV
jgi:ribonuclease HI